MRHFLKTVTTLRTAENGLVTAPSVFRDSGDALSGWRASVRAAETIAKAEGLTGHALAAHLRRE